jgi:hypothetical protein
MGRWGLIGPPRPRLALPLAPARVSRYIRAMRGYFFRSISDTQSFAFTDDREGARLPVSRGPWVSAGEGNIALLSAAEQAARHVEQVGYYVFSPAARRW